MALLLLAFMFLGLRDRVWRGSTHVTVLVITSLVLVVVFLRLGR